ncbi:MAG: FtsX-like permease family protein, partial [Blastocatellia bacterium]|nr:FtsX-like permease family protein [Blastocatellia bacterium]
RNVVGRTIALNGQSYTVIGVMPPSFVFPYGPDVTELWVGTAMDAEGQAPITGQRGNHTIEAIGRLKPGVTLGAAQAEMSRVAEGLGKQYPEMSGDLGIQVVPFYERIVGNVSWMLWVLLGAVGCVLLIACANVANLLLARAVGRQREIAIRAAMGANRWRVIRQLLTESVLISLLGGIAGLLLASWGTDFLLSLAPRAVPRVAETALDGRVLSFTLAVSLLTGILFGLAPAL